MKSGSVHPHPAQILFALFILLAALLLLSQIGQQTQFFPDKRLVDQPGFWPAIALGGMVLFAAFHLFFTWRTPRDHEQRAQAEILHWLLALEYPLWFLAYVWLVPLLGYLPTTLLFCPILTLRLGYFNRKALGWSMIAGVLIVLLFKAFLQVKIPGGMLYDSLPGALRNFMIVNF